METLDWNFWGAGREGGWNHGRFVEEITSEPSHSSFLRGKTILSDRKEESGISCRDLLNKVMELRSSWERDLEHRNSWK